MSNTDRVFRTWKPEQYWYNGQPPQNPEETTYDE